MRLSEHFWLKEFTRSAYAARRGIDMTPPPEVVANLANLCGQVLEPIRAEVGGPLYITSGYRPPAVNSGVGGALSSRHVDGLAADFIAVGMPLADLAAIVRAIGPRLPIRKAILEFGEWMHVSLAVGDQRPPAFLVATAEDGGTIYRPWVA